MTDRMPVKSNSFDSGPAQWQKLYNFYSFFDYFELWKMRQAVKMRLFLFHKMPYFQSKVEEKRLLLFRIFKIFF